MTVTLAQAAAVAAALLTIGALMTAIAKWLDSRFEKQISAVVTQLDARIERAVSDARKAASDGIRLHDTNPSAHANHKNPAKYASEIAEVKTALGQVQVQGAVIFEKIQSGQATNAERWDDLGEKLRALDAKLGGITALDHRLSKIEGEHVAIHNLRERGDR